MFGEYIVLRSFAHVAFTYETKGRINVSILLADIAEHGVLNNPTMLDQCSAFIILVEKGARKRLANWSITFDR